ncbi:MAG: type VI secretion system contractile sheath domain-containing protein [Candidatus Competibacteraceae bacterium]
MPSRMEFQLNLTQSIATRTRHDDDAPLRMLIMADFSGRAHREAPMVSPDLADRPVLAVDVDRLTAVMARLTPTVQLPVGATDETITIRFKQLDDFHPDALYQHLELFQTLRRTRARLLDPASFAQAAAELAPLLVAAPIQTDPAAASENEADLLGRLLGKAPATVRAQSVDAGAVAIQRLLHAVVQPHIVHSDSRQPAWVAAVDATIGDQLRAILHQPAFQGLEAAWRGIHDLVVNIDSDTVQIFLLDATRQELLADLRTAGGDPKATGLYQRLIERGVQMPDGQPWAALVGDYRFGAGPEDIALLAMLGSLAAQTGGPFLAAAAPELLGCDSAARLADPGQWQPLPAGVEQNWQALRRCAVAPWIGLALPRVLLRLPYGRKTDPMEAIAFEEMPGGRDPDAYLWGNPAFLCARLIAAGFAENGWEFSPGDALEIEDWPAHVYEEAGERIMQPGTEALLGERAMNAVLARGLMPILGHRQRNVVRLARFQSLAEPAATLAGLWR